MDIPQFTSLDNNNQTDNMIGRNKDNDFKINKFEDD